MPETASNMLPLGTKAKNFTLFNPITNLQESLDDHRSDVATVIMFLSNHCPYVKHIQKKLVELTQHYQAKGITFIAICSNDIEKYPADAPDKMKIEAKQANYTFPYLFDETQEIAKLYHAACTPDFYVFDKSLSCVYRGRLDGSTPGNNHPVTGADLSHALDCILAGKETSNEQIPSLGCNIKWKIEAN